MTIATGMMAPAMLNKPVDWRQALSLSFCLHFCQLLISAEARVHKAIIYIDWIW